MSVAAYLASLADQGRAANTVAAYRRDLTAYSAWLSDRGADVTHVTDAVVQDYVTHLRAVGRRPASIARALSAVRSLHRFLVDSGEAADDPTGEVARPRIPQPAARALTEAEVEKLIDAVEGHGLVARRDRALLEILYTAGLRISEAVGLSLKDVSTRGGYALRVAGEGPRVRVVPLGGVASEALASYLELRRGAAGGEALFINARGGRLTRQGAWGIVRHHGEKVGLGLAPHTLRHSCAVHMLERGADVKAVQELLGHASVTTTQHYSRLAAVGQQPATIAGTTR